jgi:hypothetical protein
MIVAPGTPPSPQPGAPTLNDEDERLDRAMADLIQDQWVNDFIKRLNYAIADIGRKR